MHVAAHLTTLHWCGTTCVLQGSLAPYLAQHKGRIALFAVAVHKNLGDNILWAAALDTRVS